MDIPHFILTALLLALLPGPDILFILYQGFTAGKKTALAASFGLSSGLLIHTTAAALGLSLIVSHSPLLLSLIKYAGVLYLIYIGTKSFLDRNKHTEPTEELPQKEQEQRSWGTMYRIGITMNLLNPKVILFFLALFPQFLSPESPSPRTDAFVLGGILVLSSLFVFSMVSITAGFISERLLNGKEMSHKTMSWVNTAVYWSIAVVFLAA